MEWWQLYLLAVLPNIGSILTKLGTVAMFGGLGALVIAAIVRTELKKDSQGYRDTVRLQRLCLPAAVAGIALLLAGTAIPSERGLMLMLGGYITTNTDGVEALPENFVGAANAFLERYAESGDDK